MTRSPTRPLAAAAGALFAGGAFAALVTVPLALTLLGSLGCGKKDDATQLAPTASALTAPSADPAVAAWRYVIDAKSTAHVDMPGLNEHIQGDTSAAAGTFDLVPHDLGRSRGLVRIDLSTFATHTF